MLTIMHGREFELKNLFGLVIAYLYFSFCRDPTKELKIAKFPIIKLKFLFKSSSSLSVLISGTLVSRLPLPIVIDALIRLLIDLKNLDENFIAIETLKKSINETTIK